MIAGYAGWIKIRSLRVSHDSYIGWEGFVKSKNFRDVSESFNACYGEKKLRGGLLSRSNAWFSGWSCADVNSPEVIFTLNYNPLKPHIYFCDGKEVPVVGKYFAQTKELSDLEFLETWNDPESRSVACRFLTEIMASVIQEKRTLVHCDAGRDRTGAVSAILMGVAAEPLDEKKIDAIECDYRLSKSLRPYKYGRVRNFLHEISKNYDSVPKWLEKTCGISLEQSKKFKKILN